MFDEFHVDKLICVQYKKYKFVWNTDQKTIHCFDIEKDLQTEVFFCKNFTAKLCERIVSNGIFNTKGTMIS